MLLALMAVVGLTSSGVPQHPNVCAAFTLGVSGVWGGDNAFVTESGDFWLRRLRLDGDPTRILERRYLLPLPSPARSNLSRLITDAEFFHLKSKRRKWIPDEPRVLVGVYRCDAAWNSIERSPHDRERRFRLIYDWFEEQTRAAEATAPVYDGDPDHGWVPDGLPAIPEWNW